MNKALFLAIFIGMSDLTRCSSIRIKLERGPRSDDVKKRPCMTQPQEKLDRMLFDHYKRTSLIFYSSPDLTTYTTDLKFNVDDIENPDRFDETQCRLSSRNATFEIVSQRSVCPWVYEIKYRVDKVPHFVREAKCTCQTCGLIGDLKMPSSLYRCLPVLKRSAVLIRNGEKCDQHGFDLWTAGIENVSIGCTCSFKTQFISI
jgi:hypothetical protein